MDRLISRCIILCILITIVYICSIIELPLAKFSVNIFFSSENYEINTISLIELPLKRLLNSIYFSFCNWKRILRRSSEVFLETFLSVLGPVKSLSEVQPQTFLVKQIGEQGRKRRRTARLPQLEKFSHWALWGRWNYQHCNNFVLPIRKVINIRISRVEAVLISTLLFKFAISAPRRIHDELLFSSWEISPLNSRNIINVLSRCQNSIFQK